MKKLVVFLLLTFCLNACNSLPPSPNEPFFCKINGKNFRPEKDSSPIGGIGSDPLRITYQENDGTLFINARNSPKETTVFIVFPNKLVKTGKFELKNDINSSKGVLSLQNDDGPVENINASIGSCIITTIENKKITGTFEFTCKSIKSGKEYKITKGCFNNLEYY